MKRNQVLFVEAEGEAVGAAYFDRDGGVHLDGVVPEHRGKGLGKLLLVETFEYMQRKGHEAAIMSTCVVLEGALDTYKSLGCERVDRLLCMVKNLI